MTRKTDGMVGIELSQAGLALADKKTGEVVAALPLGPPQIDLVHVAKGPGDGEVIVTSLTTGKSRVGWTARYASGFDTAFGEPNPRRN